jgi:hypothetical protein
MLDGTIPHPRALDTMTTRSAALITIGLLAVLLAAIVIAVLFAGDISERAGGIVSSVLGTFATVLAGLLLFLRVETINSKVDSVDSKADVASADAKVAARNAATAAQKAEEIQYDLHNGGLRSNIVRAIHEAEGDPELLTKRIETIARGVQKDRHDLRNRQAAEIGRAQMEARIQQRQSEGEQVDQQP